MYPRNLRDKTDSAGHSGFGFTLKAACCLGLLPGLVVGVLYKNTDIRTVQELLGHSDVSTAMIDAPMLKVAAGATASPLVALPLSARTLAAAMAHNWAVAQQDGGMH